MGNVKRVYVEKKPEFAVSAKGLRHEIRRYLGIMDVTGVRVLIRYDAENISDETFEKACSGVFAEPPVDILYREHFPMNEGDRSFSVEFLPGQFDQRADSAEQCIRFIKEDEAPVIRTATTYVIEGNISDEEMEAIKNHCINPVDSREAAEEKPDTLVTVFDEPEDIKVFLSVKPGLTGYSQAYYRNSADGEEKMKNDAYYARNCTFWMDVKIFFKTIAVVLGHDNTYKDTSNEEEANKLVDELRKQ